MAQTWLDNVPGRPFVITPADADLTIPAQIVECTAECSLKVTTIDGSVITKTFYKGYNPVAVSRVWLTGSAPGAATIIGYH